jgi:hypothetical protein
VEPSSSKQRKVSAVMLTSQPLMLERELIDASSTGKAGVVVEMVDTMGRILYKLDSD